MNIVSDHSSSGSPNKVPRNNNWDTALIDQALKKYLNSPERYLPLTQVTKTEEYAIL